MDQQIPILLLHLFLLFTHNTILLVAAQSSLSPVDLEVLVDIKDSLQDLPGSDFLSTWDLSSPSSDPCTSFAGILCSPDPEGGRLMRVQSLTLGTGLADTPGLTGKLTPAIGNLTYLLQFVAYAGNISGSIPPELGNLQHLQLLSITKNRISGDIPVSVTNMRSLHTLDLGYNQLQGSLPLNLTALTELKVLILASNFFSGRVPDFVSSSQLFHLDIRRNLFWGPLPRLPSSLRYLSAAQNRLSGSLTNLVGAASSELGFLDLSMNCFDGEIPGFIFGNRRLSSLLLQRNYFSGGIPANPGGVGVGGVGSTVDLSHNNLSGEITTLLTEVESVYLNNNRFTGMVPPQYVRAVYGGSMKTLYLQHNYLSGFPLVPGGAPPPDPASLCISYNCMVPPLRLACPESAGGQPSRPPYQCSVFNNSTTK